MVSHQCDNADNQIIKSNKNIHTKDTKMRSVKFRRYLYYKYHKKKIIKWKILMHLVH